MHKWHSSLSTDTKQMDALDSIEPNGTVQFPVDTASCQMPAVPTAAQWCGAVRCGAAPHPMAMAWPMPSSQLPPCCKNLKPFLQKEEGWKGFKALSKREGRARMSDPISFQALRYGVWCVRCLAVAEPFVPGTIGC